MGHSEDGAGLSQGTGRARVELQVQEWEGSKMNGEDRHLPKFPGHPPAAQ